jgi:tRNA(Ile)-lysidine synthase
VAALVEHDAASLAVLWPAIAARAGVALDRRGTARLAAFSAAGRATQPGSRIQLAGGWEVVRSRGAFQLRASQPRSFDDRCETTPSGLALSKERATSWNAGAARWSFRPSGTTIGGDSWSAWLPVDRPLWVRTWRAGDSMVWRDGFPPRKVKRFLTDAGISGHERPVWPVVLAGDQIVWIPGVRRSAEAAARSGTAGLAFACDYQC